MIQNRCFGCMEPIQSYPCPNCGFDPGKSQSAEYTLPMSTILAGKYLVGRVLGQGGFGITYIGWDMALERKVAIKEFYPSGQVSRAPGDTSLTWYSTEAAQQAQQNGMGMFLKEARKMSKVDSIPGVVRVQDLFQENATAYIIMDFVEGVTLKANLQKSGPLLWSQAKDIFLSAIRTMEQVHQAGLIHRDLSPDNLMLTPDGKVKILDLGAAKDLSINSGLSSMQVAKSGFSPWEQYLQQGGSGPWTDVYAMAATIYYTLTGKLPPNAVDRANQDTISWVEPGLAAMPAGALKALQKAMAVQARDRIQSMEILEKGLFEEKEAPAAPKVEKDKKPFNAWLPVSCGAAALYLIWSVVGLFGQRAKLSEQQATPKVEASIVTTSPTSQLTVPPYEHNDTATREYLHLMERYDINETQLDFNERNHTISALKELDQEGPQQIIAVETDGYVHSIEFRYYFSINGLSGEQIQSLIDEKEQAAKKQLGEISSISHIQFHDRYLCITIPVRKVNTSEVQKILLETGLVEDSTMFTTDGLWKKLNQSYITILR